MSSPIFPGAALTLSYCTMAGFSSPTFFPGFFAMFRWGSGVSHFGTFRPTVLQPEVCLLFGWTAASSAAVLRAFLKYPDAHVYANTR